MIFKVLKSPRAALESAARGQRVWAAAGIVGLWALLNLILTAMLVFGGNPREQFPGLSPEVLEQVALTLRNLGPPAALLFPFLWWVSVSTLMLIATPLFGGRASYAPLLAVVGVSCAPWVLGYVVQLPAGALQLLAGEAGLLSSVLGVLTFAVSLVSLVWHVILVVIGVGIATNVGYRPAAASCALTGLGCATAGFVLLISVLTLTFVLSGAT